MKNPMTLVLALAALSLGLAAPITRAQDGPPQPPKGEHPEGERKGPRGDRIKAVVEKLDLTAEQKEKVKPILEDARKAMEALRADTSIEGDARRTKGREIYQAHVAQIRALLTPEQQAKLDEMKD